MVVAGYLGSLGRTSIIGAMNISRAFGVAFGIAVLLELADAFGPFSLVPTPVLVVTQYLVLLGLGVLLGRGGHSYSMAMANALPFVFLWVAFGYVRMVWLPHENPPNWTPEHNRDAWLGYILANVIFLPLALGASCLGMFISRIGKRAHT